MYFCFTAAFDLTVTGNSAADLFICCTPAVFSKALLPQSFQAVQYNLPQSTFLFSFLPFNSLKVQGTHFSTKNILSKSNIYYFLRTLHCFACNGRVSWGCLPRLLHSDYPLSDGDPEANSVVWGHLLLSCTLSCPCSQRCSEKGIPKCSNLETQAHKQKPTQSAIHSLAVAWQYLICAVLSFPPANFNAIQKNHSIMTVWLLTSFHQNNLKNWTRFATTQRSC